MRKFIYPVLFVFMVLLAVFLFKLIAQECSTNVGSVVGYVGGDDSLIAVMDGVQNDEPGLHLKLVQKGANFDGNKQCTTMGHRSMGTGGSTVKFSFEI